MFENYIHTNACNDEGGWFAFFCPNGTVDDLPNYRVNGFETEAEAVKELARIAHEALIQNAELRTEPEQINEDLFVSPVLSSKPVKARVKIGGKVAPIVECGLSKLETELRTRSETIDKIIEAANNAGWNGVTNPKQLWRFIEFQSEENAELRAELEISNKLIEERNKVLSLFDCPEHGLCVPFAIDEIRKYKRLAGKKAI